MPQDAAAARAAGRKPWGEAPAAGRKPALPLQVAGRMPLGRSHSAARCAATAAAAKPRWDSVLCKTEPATAAYGRCSPAEGLWADGDAARQKCRHAPLMEILPWAGRGVSRQRQQNSPL